MRILTREDFRNYWQSQVDAFEANPLPGRAVVVLGDSLAAGGDWSTWYPNLAIHNRGIAGDSAEWLRNRVGQITRAEPAQVLLLIGTNDLGAHGYSPRRTHDLTRGIVERLVAESPETKVVWQSVLPRQAAFAERIAELNELNQAAAADLRNVRYLDISAPFRDSDGSLKPQMTTDGLHLSAVGYAWWRTGLVPALGQSPFSVGRSRGTARAAGRATGRAARARGGHGGVSK